MFSNNETFDETTGEIIKTPMEMKRFFHDIEEVCKKHYLSISHEDKHGSFEIEFYNEDNIRRLNGATKKYSSSNLKGFK